MTEQEQRKEAFNTGIEAAIFQWSNEQMDAWEVQNPSLVDDFYAGVEAHVESSRPAREDWE